MRAKLLSTQACANTLFDAVVSTYGPQYIIPARSRMDWIDNSFSSEEALAAKVGDARQQILDQYGFIIYNIRQDPRWRTRSGLQVHILSIISTGLDSCYTIGCIMDFNRRDISTAELYCLLSCGIAVHYQWFPTDAGPFDPKALRAQNYDFLQKLRQNQHKWQRPAGAPSASSTSSPAVPPPARQKAKYFKASGRSKTDKWEEISKNAYKELSNWCAAEHLKLSTRDVYVAYEYEGEDDEYVAPVGSVISAKEMAAYVLGIAALPKDDIAPQAAGPVINTKGMAAHVLEVADQPTVSSFTPTVKNIEIDEHVKTVSAPSAATPAPTTGESSSSPLNEPTPATKDSVPASTSTMEFRSAPSGRSVTPRATVPNIVIPTRSRSPGAESAVSLGEEDEAPFSFGSPAAPRAPDFAPVSPRPPLPSPAVAIPPSNTVEAVGHHEIRKDRTTQMESNSSRHHGRDDSPAHYVEYRRPAHYRLPTTSFPQYASPSAIPSSSCPPPPHRQEHSAFLDDDSSSSRKRTISSVSSPSRAGENKRPRMVASLTSLRPTLLNRLHNVVTSPPAASPTLLDRIHNVATFTAASPLAPELSMAQQLPPPLVRIPPVLAEVGLPLIAESYQADELQTDGPVFMMGITFPVAPALSNPDSSPADSIPTLLRSGAPFQILAPLPNTAPQDLAVVPSYLSRRNIFQGFDLQNPGYWTIYTARVRELLCLPFARRFLTQGGILWRIALQFGPNTLVQEALVGPSSAVTLWRSGESVGNLWDDFITPEEINTLLGRSSSGSESC
ncbi:hypothetical protein F4604DRAFT_1920517 [Suillus subluteus]|nr:hypothetical protein F4604DRAFT_1920517 [Suillus subluteus]